MIDYDCVANYRLNFTVEVKPVVLYTFSVGSERSRLFMLDILPRVCSSSHVEVLREEANTGARAADSQRQSEGHERVRAVVAP